MTRTLVFSLFALLLGFTNLAFAEEADVVVANFHKALEKGDGDLALSFLDKDVVIYEGGYVERNREEYENHHLGADMAFSAGMEREILRKNLHVDGNTAYYYSESLTRGEFKNKKYNRLGTETMVLKKTEAGWKITHIHWSSRQGSEEN